MRKKDDQQALAVVLKLLKVDKVSLTDILRTINSYQVNVPEIYRDLDLELVSESWQNLFLDGWFSPDPKRPEGYILTTYGKSQLERAYHPVFLDPVSTIQDIRDSIRNMDSVALDYFQESLWAIKKGLYLSATVTLGCASEQSILLLIEAILDYYGDDELRVKFNNRRSIKSKFDLLVETIQNKNLKKEVPEKFRSDKVKYEEITRLFIDFDTMLNQIFSIYRINRNEAGHPTGRHFDEDIVKANAAMFKKYCEVIFGLISYL